MSSNSQRPSLEENAGESSGSGISSGAGLPAQKRRSQSSISRWFGAGEEEDSSDSEGAGGMRRVNEDPEGSLRSTSPGEYGGSGMGLGLISGDNEDSDSDDAEVIVTDDDGGEVGRSEYSPPQQDPGH
jgi:hypothetical protein